MDEDFRCNNNHELKSVYGGKGTKKGKTKCNDCSNFSKSFLSCEQCSYNICKKCQDNIIAQNSQKAEIEKCQHEKNKFIYKEEILTSGSCYTGCNNETSIHFLCSCEAAFCKKCYLSMYPDEAINYESNVDNSENLNSNVEASGEVNGELIAEGESNVNADVNANVDLNVNIEAVNFAVDNDNNLDANVEANNEIIAEGETNANAEVNVNDNVDANVNSEFKAESNIALGLDTEIENEVNKQGTEEFKTQSYVESNIENTYEVDVGLINNTANNVNLAGNFEISANIGESNINIDTIADTNYKDNNNDLNVEYGISNENMSNAVIEGGEINIAIDGNYDNSNKQSSQEIKNNLENNLQYSNEEQVTMSTSCNIETTEINQLNYQIEGSQSAGLNTGYELNLQAINSAPITNNNGKGQGSVNVQIEISEPEVVTTRSNVDVDFTRCAKMHVLVEVINSNESRFCNRCNATGKDYYYCSICDYIHCGACYRGEVGVQAHYNCCIAF